MKRLLLTVALLAAWSASAQPILRNSFNTNALGTNLVYEPLFGKVTMSTIGPSYVLYNTAGGVNNKVFYLTSVANSFQLNWASDDASDSRTLGYFDTNGNYQVRGFVGMSDTTNQLTITNGVLLLDGVPISGTATTPINNFYATNIFYQSGKGNTLIITQALTLLYAKTNLLATDANGLVTTTKFGAGIAWDPATQTISASGSSDTTATNIVTLTQTGTNAAQLDFALVARGGVFKLSLTNNAYFGAPANVNNTDFKHCWLAVQQPSTGTCLVTFTNGFFAQPGGLALVNDTNAGAVVWYELTSDVFTNGLVNVWMSQKSQLVP